jgi:hypothetical protein
VRTRTKEGIFFELRRRLQNVYAITRLRLAKLLE